MQNQNWRFPVHTTWEKQRIFTSPVLQLDVSAVRFWTCSWELCGHADSPCLQVLCDGGITLYGTIFPCMWVRSKLADRSKLQLDPNQPNNQTVCQKWFASFRCVLYFWKVELFAHSLCQRHKVSNFLQFIRNRTAAQTSFHKTPQKLCVLSGNNWCPTKTCGLCFSKNTISFFLIFLQTSKSHLTSKWHKITSFFTTNLQEWERSTNYGKVVLCLIYQYFVSAVSLAGSELQPFAKMTQNTDSPLQDFVKKCWHNNSLIRGHVGF